MMKELAIRLFYLIFLMIVVVVILTLILSVTGVSVSDVGRHLMRGALSSYSRVGHTIKNWIPLLICSLSLLYTFRINLWNIGVEGQVIMGAVFTTLVFRLGSGLLQDPLVIIFGFIAGLAGGSIWAVAAGFLKTKGNVNEIFAGLGLNFLAQGFVLWLIFGPWRRPGVASMSGTEPFDHGLWLAEVSPLRLSPVAIGVAAVIFGLTWFILYRSKTGLDFRAIGLNPRAAALFGLSPSKKMLLAMLFAGGFAGIAGAVQVAGVYHRLIPSISSNYGYLALLVVMLAGYRIWPVIPISFFFACLNTGSIQLPMVLQIDSSLSGVIQGLLVLAALAFKSRRPLKRTGI